MSRRDLIRMSPAEIDAYLNEPHLCRIGTIGPGGSIHMVAMNYGFVDGVPSFWTYGKAQKVKNLERNPSIGMIVDSGVKYSELKGAHLMGQAELIDDPAKVAALWESMKQRYGIANQGAAESSAPKRLVVKVHADKILSWDHGKLGGGY
ncbi:MAG: pyridoxamine 5'-phosphate oxidase family protein [Acidimicrobiales bacterium]